ncbi:hypothetical protein [Zavarzinella formosa]|uniref:hypothetical protein n=1 Tax=Zavarzinella formosa TaxID=360055 RepID=UPI0002DB778F|nr:hypothetical protein [Zavarzinella formosa]
MKDDDLDDAAPHSRRPRNDEREERPAPKRAKTTESGVGGREDTGKKSAAKRAGKKGPNAVIVFVVGGVGLVLLAGVGVGAWLLFFSGGGAKVGNPVATRDLPKSRFAFMPGTAGSVHLVDYGPQSPGETSTPVPILGVNALKVSDVECRVTHTGPPGLTSIVTYFLREPFDLSALAKGQPEWLIKQIGDRTAYSQKSKGMVAFQPAPKILVTVTEPTTSEPLWKLAETIMKRTEVDFSLPDEQWELMQEVSGYDNFTAGPVKSGDIIASILPKFQAVGNRGLGTGSETYKVSVFKSEDEARKALAEHFLIEKKTDQMMKELREKTGGKELSKQDRSAWVTGKYLRTLTITTKQ